MCVPVYIVPVCAYPLSDVKNMNVFLSTPASSSATNTSPTAQSISFSESPNRRRMLELVNSSPANCGWCGCWNDTKSRNGLLAALRESSASLSVHHLHTLHSYRYIYSPDELFMNEVAALLYLLDSVSRFTGCSIILSFSNSGHGTNKLSAKGIIHLHHQLLLLILHGAQMQAV